MGQALTVLAGGGRLTPMSAAASSSSSSLITIVLSSELRDYFAESQFRGQGGFQSLGRLLAERLQTSKVLRLTPEELARVVHYARNYGNGGFQSKLRELIVEYVAQHPVTEK